MGGRGSSSSGGGGGLKTLTPGGGGGTSGKQHFSNGLGFQNYKTGAEALGVQGKPMSMTTATLGTNPHYSRDYSEFSENCQRCVVANEARRRGYDVTAQPTYKNDTMPRGQNWNKAFENPQPKTMTSRRQVEVEMASYGNGARAVMTFGWKNSTSGHAINVEYNRGKITYLDPQVGGKYTASELYKSMSNGHITLTRVDNLKFSDNVKQAVTKDKW